MSLMSHENRKNRKNRKNRGKTALLAVSFGTSHPEADAAAIKPVETALKAVFKDLEVRRAFTSRMIVRKLASRGKYIPSPENALRVLEKEGFENIIVQPFHFLEGHEFEKKIVEPLKAFRGGFKKFVVGRPMLSDEGDIQDMAGIVAELSRQSGGELVLLMGHGTDHGADKTYAALQSVLDEGNINAVIATVEGSVVLESVLDRIEKTAGRGGTVHLYPLMLVAGDHAKNDMAGEDSESWKSVLSALGYNVVPWLKGMGGNIHFQQMVVRHVRESRRIIFPERYEKMKKGRAARELVRAREDIEWFPVVNADLCTGCGVCLLYCHRDVYAFEKNGSGRDAVIVKNPYNCVVNCSHCRKYCPAGAISFPGKMEGVWREKR